MTDRKSQTTSFTYDGLGRRTLATFAGGSSITYTHHVGNWLTQAVDSASGSIGLAYDNRGRLTSETNPQGTGGAPSEAEHVADRAGDGGRYLGPDPS